MYTIVLAPKKKLFTPTKFLFLNNCSFSNFVSSPKNCPTTCLAKKTFFWSQPTFTPKNLSHTQLVYLTKFFIAKHIFTANNFFWPKKLCWPQNNFFDWNFFLLTQKKTLTPKNLLNLKCFFDPQDYPKKTCITTPPPTPKSCFEPQQLFYPKTLNINTILLLLTPPSKKIMKPPPIFLLYQLPWASHPHWPMRDADCGHMTHFSQYKFWLCWCMEEDIWYSYLCIYIQIWVVCPLSVHHLMSPLELKCSHCFNRSCYLNNSLTFVNIISGQRVIQ